MFISGVNDTGDKLLGGVNDTADKYSFRIISANFRKNSKRSQWHTVKAGNVVTFGAQNNFFLRISFR
jgi:hypothetical protein